MLRFDRKQQNSGKQLSFNKKIIKKKKNPNGEGLESFWVGEHMEVPGEQLAGRGHGSSVPFAPYIFLCFPSVCLAVPEFYPCVIN